jgi:hypothetical protein
MLIAFWFSNEHYLMIFLVMVCYETFRKNLKLNLCVCVFLISILPRMCILNVIYSLNYWIYPLIIFFFKLIICCQVIFVELLETVFLFVINVIQLLHSDLHLLIYINFCIKRIDLYYGFIYVIIVVFNSDRVNRKKMFICMFRYV